MAKEKKAKEIKAEMYDENAEIDTEINIEDDTYEEEFEDEFEDEEIEETKIKYVDPDTSEETEEESEEDISEAEQEEYEDAKKTFNRAKADKIMKVYNVIFVIAMIAMLLIGIDVICVARYNVGPFFAIKTNTYKDGGTKEYYGLGYKVIKYNVIEGRKDTQIGFWNMPYSTAATEIQDIDLAIEFQNNPEKTSNKYYKQYLAISSKIKSIDQTENKLVLEYTDPDGKYTLQIDCQMASDKDKLIDFTEQQEVTVKGTVYKFALKDEKQSNTVYVSDCFAQNKE